MSLIACGSSGGGGGKTDGGKTADAKVFMDAHAGSSGPDLSCFGMSNPTTASDPVTISGTTDFASLSGYGSAANITVDVYKTGNATKLTSVTSDSNGAFTTSSIATGGQPLAGYLHASTSGTSYRSTYVYPPRDITANLAGVPVPLVTTLIGQAYGQDDTTSGIVLVLATDCAQQPLSGVTVTVQQGGSDVGTFHDLSAELAGAAGYTNVPAGETTIGGTYMGMTFPTHTIVSYTKSSGADANGATTVTTIQPGP